jgi:hypothetical protein
VPLHCETLGGVRGIERRRERERERERERCGGEERRREIRLSGWGGTTVKP